MTAPDLPTLADVRTIAAAMAHRYGGSAALRDSEALAQTLLRPHLRRHPDLLSVTASLMEGFELHRPFAQGNHRVMLATADVFLRLHRHRFTVPQEQLGGEMVRMLRANAFDHARVDTWLRTVAGPEGVA